MSKKLFVDKYGELKEKEKEIKKELKELETQIKDEVKVGETMEGADFKVVVYETVIVELDPRKVKRIINNDNKFLNVIKVSNTNVKEYLSKEQMDKCIIDSKVSQRIRCSRA